MAENTPISLNCPACGAPLDYDGSSPTIRCKFCGNISIMPAPMQGTAAIGGKALEDILQLAGSGDLIEAIKKYRGIYGVGLKEAKDAVEAMQAGRMALPTAPGMRPADELTRALEEVQKLLAEGKKLDAIKVYRENYDVSLARATYAIDQIQAGQTTFPEAGFTAQLSKESVLNESKKAGKKVQRLGCTLAGGVIILIAALVAYFLLSPGGPLSIHYSAVGPVTEITSENTSVNFALNLYDSKKDVRFIGLVDASTGKLSWHAVDLPGKGNVDGITDGTDMIYAAEGINLLAYNKSDGGLAWQTLMPDRLNYGIHPMLFKNGVLFVENADQSIQAYDGATGAMKWNRRLKGYDRTLRLIGSSLVVVDYGDDSYDYSMFFLDPFTGMEQAKITPVCTHNDFTFQALDPDSGLIYDTAANALYVVLDYSYACVQRYDLVNGQLTWQATNDEYLNFPPAGLQFLQTDSRLYFNGSENLYSVDKNTGTLTTLLANPDYEFVPLEIAGETLIVEARKTRGSEKFEIWSVNDDTGEIAWQVDLGEAQPIDPPNEMAGLIDDTDHGWTWKLLPTGLAVITFKGEPNQVDVESYSLANGETQGKQTLALANVSGDFYDIPTIIGWNDTLGYFLIDWNIYSLDLSASKVKLIY